MIVMRSVTARKVHSVGSSSDKNNNYRHINAYQLIYYCFDDWYWYDDYGNANAAAANDIDAVFVGGDDYGGGHKSCSSSQSHSRRSRFGG